MKCAWSCVRWRGAQVCLVFRLSFVRTPHSCSKMCFVGVRISLSRVLFARELDWRNITKRTETTNKTSPTKPYKEINQTNHPKIKPRTIGCLLFSLFLLVLPLGFLRFWSFSGVSRSCRVCFVPLFLSFVFFSFLLSCVHVFFVGFGFCLHCFAKSGLLFSLGLCFVVLLCLVYILVLSKALMFLLC